MAQHEPAGWVCEFQLEKYDIRSLLSPTEERDLLTIPRLSPRALGLEPYEHQHHVGNMLTYGGVSALFDRLIDATPTVGVFDNSNAYLGVGDSSTAAAATQTDLQAATNKHREAMDASFPTHTDGTDEAAASVVFKSTFETGDANFTWNEWGLFNASTSGRMLSRRVFSGGTKTSSDTWTLTVTYTIS